jgi:arginase family enzyme
MLDLFEGVAARNTIIGATMVEYVADCDPSGLGAQTAARLLCNVIAALTRSASP